MTKPAPERLVPEGNIAMCKGCSLSEGVDLWLPTARTAFQHLDKHKPNTRAEMRIYGVGA